MSKQLSELCALLVEDIHGELPSRLFSILVEHNRLSLHSLALNVLLPVRLVKNALAVLIQHNLVLYSSAPNVPTTYYEANWQRAYGLLRYGKYVRIVSARCGTGAGKIFEQLQAQGHATTQSLLASTADTLPNGHANDSLTNGTHESNGTPSRQQSQSQEDADKLQSSGYITHYRNLHSMPDLDVHDMIERIVQYEVPSFAPPISGPKKEKEFRDTILDYKFRIRSGEQDLVEPAASFKRGQDDDFQDEGRSRKKRKMNAGHGHGVRNGDEYQGSGAQESSEPPYDIHEKVYQVNEEKLAVAIRNEYLVELCNLRLGEVTSKIYATILRVLEKSIDRCKDDLDDQPQAGEYYLETLPAFNAKEVAAAVEPELDLLLRKNSNVKEEPTESATFEHADGTEAKKHARSTNDPQKTHDVDQAIKLLEEHPARFVTKVRINGLMKYKVDFNRLVRQAMQFEIEAVVTARYGKLAARVVRILNAKGKLDEKQVGTLGLLRQKELRSTLTSMQEGGFVDTQEIPRDGSRQPSRTIYLWYYDQDRSRQLLLNDIYKSMARLMQRRQVEQEKMQGLIDKSERTDVQGHEEQYLTVPERQALKEWSDREEKLLVQLSRQDDLVTLLRDLLPLRMI